MALLLVWAPAILSVLYAKSGVMRYAGYKMIRAGLNASHDLTLPQQFSTLRLDLFLTLILVPGILVLLAIRRPRSGWVALTTFSSFVIIIITNIQLEAFKFMGRPQRFSALREAFEWRRRNGFAGGGYVSNIALIRLGTLLVLLAVLFVYSLRVTTKPQQECRAGNLPARCLRGFFFIALFVTLLAWLPWMRPTSFHESFLLSSFHALASGGAVPGAPDYFYRTRRHLADEYRLLTSSHPGPASNYYRAAEGYDILVFVMESVPSACVDFAADTPEFATIEKLKQRAWVATRHYSTYPNTIRALWSMFTSTYPPNGGLSTLGLLERPSTGITEPLRANGYRRVVYAPGEALTPATVDTLHTLGFPEVLTGSDNAVREPDFETDSVRINWIRKADGEALQALKADVTSSIQRSQRYMIVYTPQITHGPWVLTSQPPNPWQYCRGLVEELDSSLGEILQVVDLQGRANKTLIVVTGDHGIRGTAEDPGFPGYYAIDGTMFQVPFLLYAPGILGQRVNLQWVTSHIDIAPSIQELLGITGDPVGEQGMPLWDPNIADRATFFWAGMMMGSDGYHSHGTFYSWNYLADVLYKNMQLKFNMGSSLHDGDSSHSSPAQIRKMLREMDSLRVAWTGNSGVDAPGGAAPAKPPH